MWLRLTVLWVFTQRLIDLESDGLFYSHLSHLSSTITNISFIHRSIINPNHKSGELMDTFQVKCGWWWIRNNHLHTLYTSLKTLMTALPVRKSPKLCNCMRRYYLKNGWLNLNHHFGVKSSFSTPHTWSSCDDIAGWHQSATPWPGDMRSRAMACRSRSRHTPLMTKTCRSPSICL